METQIALNLKYLRKTRNLTQETLAKSTGITRAQIGSYEEGRAIPKIHVLNALSDFFVVSVDDLLNAELWNKPTRKVTRFLPEILTIVTDEKGDEKVLLVPDKASAGYASGYADKEYIEALPAFNLPLPELNRNKSYRVFQIRGESMLPVKPGSYIIGEYVTEVENMKEGTPCIVVSSNEGLVFKRLFNEADSIRLVSDNKFFSEYAVPKTEILEIWKAVGFISFDLNSPHEIPSLQNIHDQLLELKHAIKLMSGKNSGS
ncbi:MAG: LexA family transcriptional regulator [Bacteroidales bacterium]|nr:LexA family transcriptional regulator [Bacteroidales bacterium]